MFAALMLLGLGLIISGIAYDVSIAQNIEAQSMPARVLELCGIVVWVSTVFGTAGYIFYRRLREEAEEKKHGGPRPLP